MADIQLLRLLLLTAATILLLPAAGGEITVSIHDLLREHGLPPGLLPKAVDSYTFDQTSGLLEVRLDRPCYAKYDGPAFFDQVIRGNLSYGALHGVVGLKQEELFLWLPVRGIIVSNPFSGVILFDIGVARKQLSLSLFEVPPDCNPVGTKLPAAGARVNLKGEEARELIPWPTVFVGAPIRPAVLLNFG
ncbi:hypothetical protein KSP40_PGU012543 [Platanthera guangdongensis]|uniref:Uncharacterized protein n=1 Tax=Platanthera guangdongensis TaxID=2320717 RepID=A0ABR2LX51_9ASPA